MILNLFIVSLSGKGFSHYGLVSLPSLIYPVSSSSTTIKNYFKNKAYLFDFFLLATSALLFWFIIDNYLTTIPALSSGNPQESRNERIVSFIVDNTEPSDRILVLGYKDYYYVESDRLASSKFHFFLPMNEDYPGGLLSVAEDINKYPAKIVIVEGYVCPYFDFGNYCLVDEDLDIWMYIDDITSQ